MADAGGQQVLSPYHAMGCNPVSMVDPLGLQYFAPGEKRANVGIPNAGIHVFEDGTVAIFGGNSIDLETKLLQADERFTGFMLEAFLRKALGIGNRRAGTRGSGSQGGGNQGNSSASGNTSGAVKAEANGIKFNTVLAELLPLLIEIIRELNVLSAMV